ncbi:hypothetical protein QVD17_00054 [Tagetes erecta]|uniref:Uncharacterized protein n=1 Tax=Tagetes erecta TaxID=13708 RepID=A0AAD8L3W6_TARER|nr:hypothetical protein QVD17_00054 [Tagetes erecta]
MKPYIRLLQHCYHHHIHRVLLCLFDARIVVYTSCLRSDLQFYGRHSSDFEYLHYPYIHVQAAVVCLKKTTMQTLSELPLVSVK